MKPKERRDLLFKNGRPKLRPMQITQNNGMLGKDIAVLWAAYSQGSFPFDVLPEGLSEGEFAREMLELLSLYEYGWIIEDRTPLYNDGYGPVGLMLAFSDGWELEPHYQEFAWTTPRIVLRSIVSFLQMMRYDKTVGVVNVYALEKSRNLFDHVRKYGVLSYLGMVPNGDHRGDKYVYYTKGSADINAQGAPRKEMACA